MSAEKSIRVTLWDIVVESSLLSDAEFVRPAHLRFIAKAICNLWFAQIPRTGQIPAQPLKMHRTASLHYPPHNP